MPGKPKSLIAGLLLAFALSPAAAQDYPKKTVTLVVPFAPGGSSDLISRLVAQKLTELWKQQVIVDNRPGGAGVIAMKAVARAAPDGHTLILGHIGTLAVNPAMFANLDHDPVKDFSPVSLLAKVPNVLAINPQLPATTLKEFVAHSRAKPGAVYYGSAGNGSAGHLAMEYLKQASGADLSHVPYRGTGPMLTDLLSGQTQATFTGAIPMLPHIKAGKLRPLAVGSAKRLEALPDTPTVAEAGFPGFETSQWYGILAPAGTPPDIVRKLSADLNSVLRLPDVVERLTADGSLPSGSTPEEFAAFIQGEAAHWGKVVKAAGVKPD